MKKSKTNISVVNNVGIRRNADVHIGGNGPYPSGDILDANAVKQDIDKAVASVIDSAPEALDTLKEIADLADTFATKTQLAENEQVVSQALNDLNDRLDANTNSIEDLVSGETSVKYAQESGNLQSWAERDDLSVSDTWSDRVRTTAGSVSIDSSVPAKIVSIVAKEDFYADSIVATGFNLLRHAVQVGIPGSGDDGKAILVPKMRFGEFGTAEEANGLLITDENGNNLNPNVYFTTDLSQIPTSVYTNQYYRPEIHNGYAFYVPENASYLLIPQSFLNAHPDICIHVAWSRRYDEYIGTDVQSDAGSAIQLSNIISAIHNYNMMLTASNGSNVIADNIRFEDNLATWTRNVDRVQPTWNTVANIVEEGGSQTYTHTATINGMMPDGIVECGDISFTVENDTISYQSDSSVAVTGYVKYELANPVSGTVSISNSYAVEDWGLEMLTGNVVGSAYITTQYAQSYPDSLALIAQGSHENKMQVLVEAIAELRKEVDTLAYALKYQGDVKANSVDVVDGYNIIGQKMFDVVTSAPTELPNAKGLFRYDTVNKALYVSKSVTNSTSDWSIVQ